MAVMLVLQCMLWGVVHAQDAQILGFGDVDYVTSERDATPDGFRLGQLVGHVAARLSDRIAFFSEVSEIGRAHV